MEIFNRIVLSSILELLLWSTGKVYTYFCNIEKLLMSHKVKTETSITNHIANEWVWEFFPHPFVMTACSFKEKFVVDAALV